MAGRRVVNARIRDAMIGFGRVSRRRTSPTSARGSSATAWLAGGDLRGGRNEEPPARPDGRRGVSCLTAWSANVSR